MDISLSASLKTSVDNPTPAKTRAEDDGKTSNFSQMLDRMRDSAQAEQARAEDSEKEVAVKDPVADPTLMANPVMMPLPQQPAPAQAADSQDEPADARVENTGAASSKTDTKPAENETGKAASGDDAPETAATTETPATVKPYAEILSAAGELQAAPAGDLAQLAPQPAIATPQPAQTTPQATATVQVPVSSPAFAPAFSHQIMVFVKDRSQTAELRLNPDDIGPINVRISITDARAEIDFAVTSPEAKAAIQNALPQLRDTLAAQGLELGGTSVDQRQAGTFGQDEPGKSGNGKGGTGEGTTGTEIPVRRPVGLVDTYA